MGQDINHKENKLWFAGRAGVSLLSLDVSYFMHAMAEVETLRTTLRKENVLRKEDSLNFLDQPQTFPVS